MLLNNLYYCLKPFIPRHLQVAMRRKYVLRQRLACANIWPIAEQAGNIPEGFPGWPEQKKFALILTHDVDTAGGQEKCHDLIKLEENLGFKSFFSFVPRRYQVSAELRHFLVNKGFEVAVHGLLHDGKLYKNKKIFEKRAGQINKYLKEWEAVGFRSPAMHSNLEWIHAFNIEYDASTFDTDPLEPHDSAANTIFPFWISDGSKDKGYVEIPYTLPQDFTLFVLMKEQNIDIWQRKLDWIVKKGGMALINVHPDYMNFGDNPCGIEEYPAHFYADFLNYVKAQYQNQYWHALPKDVARFWLKNKIELTPHKG